MQAGETNVCPKTGGFNQWYPSKMESYEKPEDCHPPLASVLIPKKDGERQQEIIYILGTEHCPLLSLLASIINTYHSPTYYVPGTTKHFNYIISFNPYDLPCRAGDIIPIL